MRRLCGEGLRSYLGRPRLTPERATVMNRSEGSAKVVVAANKGRRATREGEPTTVSLGRAVHQKPGLPGRTASGRGEAESATGRDEARLARPETEGLGRDGLLAQALARANLVAAGNTSRPIAAVLGWMD
jgi:hypothetical protein